MNHCYPFQGDRIIAFDCIYTLSHIKGIVVVLYVGDGKIYDHRLVVKTQTNTTVLNHEPDVSYC